MSEQIVAVNAVIVVLYAASLCSTITNVSNIHDILLYSTITLTSARWARQTNIAYVSESSHALLELLCVVGQHTSNAFIGQRTTWETEKYISETLVTLEEPFTPTAVTQNNLSDPTCMYTQTCINTCIHNASHDASAGSWLNYVNPLSFWISIQQQGCFDFVHAWSVLHSFQAGPCKKWFKLYDIVLKDYCLVGILSLFRRNLTTCSPVSSQTDII